MNKLMCIFALATSLISACGTYSPSPMVSGWFADAKSGCKVWVDEPMPLSRVNWDGSCVDGKLSGIGRIYYFDGAINSAQYKGNFVDGKMNGQGKFVFDPAWNMRNGQLVYSIYTGNWLNGKKSGRGELVLPNGDHYEGNWLDGNMHGEGRLVTRSGTQEKKGNFSNGKYMDKMFIHSPLQLAILKKSTEEVQELVSKGENLAVKDKHGRDILTLAAESNIFTEDIEQRHNDSADTYAIYQEMLTKLIIEKVNEDSEKNVKYMRDRGIREMEITQRDPETDAQMVKRSKRKPLTSDQKRIIEILINGGAKIDVISPKFEEYIGDALSSRNYILLNKLLNAGMSVDAKVGGKRLIQYAIEFDNIEFVKSLVLKQATLDVPTSKNENLVFYAVASAQADIAKFLAKSGAPFPDIYSGASAALKKWNFSEYAEWVKRGNVLGVLNSKQISQLELLRTKENSLFLAEQARIAEQARVAEQSRRANASVLSSGSVPSCSGSGSYKAVLYCRTSGFLSYNSEPFTSFSCGNCSDWECEAAFKKAMVKEYSSLNEYTAQEKICGKRSGNWYPDRIKIERR